ncbi:MAG TPA: PilN domain-containing protein [Azospira sp.]|nr:PilN domain-containing protein [Azospira sp.]
MIAPLWLDYQRADPGRRRAGVLLLGAGVLAGSLLFGYYADLVAEQEAVQQAVSRLQRAAARALPAAAAGVPASGGGATQAVAFTGNGTAPAALPRSAAAWEALFAALEAAGDESVTLLGLQPGGGQLAIAGEARDLPAAMDYLTRLQSAPVFAEVRLTQSEIVVAHPQRPLRFALQASWRGEPAAASDAQQPAGQPAGQPAEPRAATP